MNPVAIHIGPLEVRWYGLLIVTGILAAAYVASREARRRGQDPERIWDGLILCLIGGFTGNLLSLLQNGLFDLLNPAGMAAMVPVAVSWDIILESMGLSLLLGMAGSLYPALRASRLLPAEALRYE